METFDPCATPPIEEKVRDLAEVSDVVPQGTSADVSFRVTNPSGKLRLTLEVFVQPGLQGTAGGGPEAHDYAQDTWQLHAVTRRKMAGDIRLNAVFYDATTFPPTATARPMPDSYEVISGVQVIHGTVHCQPQLAAQPGERYMICARWEPIDPEMSTKERAYWFAFCELTTERPDPTPVRPPEA